MNDTQLERAAGLLVEARRTRVALDRLPEDCRPATLQHALAIQSRVVSRLKERVAGWKVARLPDGQLAYGMIVGSRVVRSGGTVEAQDMPLLGMEAEVAFRFLEDAPARTIEYSDEEVADRVVAFSAMEIVATRYRDYHNTPVIERTADLMSNGAFVVGADQPDWRSMDLSRLPASLMFDAAVIVDRVGEHPAGNPLRPAVDLVNALRGTIGVHAGQMITTGTYTGLNFAKRGQKVTAKLAGFEPVIVSVA